jgi:hypothetical protein
VGGSEETGVVTAPVKDSVVPRSVMDDGLIAHVAVSKFVDHLPLYRLEKIFERQGVSLSRKTMCDTLLAAAGPLGRLAERIEAKVRSNGVVHHDDTPVDLLTEGMSHTAGIKEGRLWVATVPPRDGPWTCFRFSTGRQGSNIEDFFKDYEGVVMSDDFSGYDRLEATVIQLRCMVHARRKFFEAKDSSPLEASEMLEWISQLYKLERTVPPDSDHDPQRLAMRQEEAKPKLEAMKERLEAMALTALPKSPLGKAVSYALNNWNLLTRYVEDGRFPLDNNTAEQAIRPVALGRKNWLFMGSVRGGQAAAVYMTIMATCKRAGVNPYEYLRDVLGRLMSHPVTKLDDLLPKIKEPVSA